MRQVVIDTNCLVQMISLHSPYRLIWNAFLAGKFQLCISNEILEEYQEIIEEQTTSRIAENVILLLLNRRCVHFPYAPSFASKMVLGSCTFIECQVP